MIEGPVAADEAVDSASCATVTWTADQLTDSAYPWDLPTLRDKKKTHLTVISNHKPEKKPVSLVRRSLLLPNDQLLPDTS